MLLALVGAVLMLDSLFFSALAPLLPDYVQRYSLSSTHAGLLVAMDAIGGVVAALPTALLIRRFGPKAVTLSGLVVVAASSTAFGVADSIAAVDLSRFFQGAGSTLAWAASLTWLVSVVEPERRGRSIGLVLGSSAVGSMLGPALGSLASYIGTGPSFGGAAVVCMALALAGMRLRSGQRQRPRQRRGRRLRSREMRTMALVGWLVTLPALIMAALLVSAPLRLESAGLGAAAIGAVFLVTAGSEALLGPGVGHWSDRSGRRQPLLVGATVAGIGAAIYPGVEAGAAVAVLTVVVGIGALMFSAPALALLADLFQSLGLAQESGFALQNAAWGAGHVAGAVGAGALASATTESVPFLLMAAVCLLTLPLIRGVQDLAPNPEPQV